MLPGEHRWGFRSVVLCLVASSRKRKIWGVAFSSLDFSLKVIGVWRLIKISPALKTEPNKSSFLMLKIKKKKKKESFWFLFLMDTTPRIQATEYAGILGFRRNL